MIQAFELLCRKKVLLSILQTLLVLSFALPVKAVSIQHASLCGDVFSGGKRVQASAIDAARQLLQGLMTQLQQQEQRMQIRSEEHDIDELAAVNAFNAKRDLPSTQVTLRDVELETSLDGEVQSVHYGLRGRKKGESPRLDILDRLNFTVQEFTDYQTSLRQGNADKSQKLTAKAVIGREQIRQFIRIAKLQARATLKINGRIDESLREQEDGDSESQWLQRLRARHPVLGELVSDLQYIWTVGFVGGLVADPLIKDGLNKYFGFEIPFPTQISTTLLALGKAALGAMLKRPIEGLSVEEIRENVSDSGDSRFSEESVTPLTTFNQPFVRYLRGLNQIAQGRWHLKDKEFWYLATEYTRKPEKGHEADPEDVHQLDLFLFKDQRTGEPTLIVLRR